MGLESIVFYLFAVIVVASALVVVLSKKIMYAAFSLLFTLFGIAGMYAMLMADFIAVAQIMIYVGGILVLIVFGVMLTTKITGVDVKTGPTGKLNYIAGGLLAVMVAGSLAWLYTSNSWISAPVNETNTSINAVGNLLLTEYLLAFEVGSVLLLIALIGAALIARRK
ncbi:MAG: NADH-quinone oxidoreductase subunit J [Candidatus Kapabacteria bacterium]|nr:NADH-quinone oxidoreductase subunit J [Candidatus Kapabacteria bacterium]